MFENLKAGDTIKIGKKEFKVAIKSPSSIIQTIVITDGKENLGITYSDLKFLGAEIVRKAPPKYMAVKRFDDGGCEHFGVSCGKFDFKEELIVLVDGRIERWKKWEVLEIEK